MNDSQIVAIAITVFAVLAGSIFNNVRIGDLNNRFADLGARINDTHNKINDTNNNISETNNNISARLTDLKEVLRAEMRQETGDLRHLIERNQEALLAELARIGQRVTRLEERIH